MRLPPAVTDALFSRLVLTATRPPDLEIGGALDPLVRRWHLSPWTLPQRVDAPEWQGRKLLPNIYLHNLLRPDDDRALHDHPWVNLTIVLKGFYTEHTIAQGGIHHRVTRRRGDVVFRPARRAHRLEVTQPAWTLFLTGPKVRAWGFHHPTRGWIHWKDFVAGVDGSVVRAEFREGQES